MRAIIPYARIFFPSLPLFHPVQIHFVQGGHSTFPEPFISAVISLPRFCNADGNARKQLSSADDLENDDRLRFIAHCGQRESERERERERDFIVVNCHVEPRRNRVVLSVMIYNCGTRDAFNAFPPQDLSLARRF